MADPSTVDAGLIALEGLEDETDETTETLDPIIVAARAKEPEAGVGPEPDRSPMPPFDPILDEVSTSQTDLNMIKVTEPGPPASPVQPGDTVVPDVMDPVVIAARRREMEAGVDDTPTTITPQIAPKRRGPKTHVEMCEERVEKCLKALASADSELLRAKKAEARPQLRSTDLASLNARQAEYTRGEDNERREFRDFFHKHGLRESKTRTLAPLKP